MMRDNSSVADATRKILYTDRGLKPTGIYTSFCVWLQRVIAIKPTEEYAL